MKMFGNMALFVLLAASSGSVLSINASDQIEVTPILKTQNSWDGNKIVYPEGTAEVTGMIIEMAPGGETGWHLHPVPSFGFLQEGVLEVQFKDGTVKHLAAGQAAAEAVNVLHNGRNVGEVPAKLVVFYMGTTDKKLTIKEGETNPLAFSEWSLVTLNGKESLAIKHPTMKFEDGKVYVFGGINWLNGGYTLVEDSLKFGPLASTRMAGDPEAMELESTLAKVLATVDAFQVSGKELTLSSKGVVVATLHSE